MTDGRELWKTANSLGELGQLTAAWLEGSKTEHPGYASDRPDDETKGLISDLALLNRAGYWTDCSQPGVLDRAGRQRAFVTGFASTELAERLVRAVDDAGLVALVLPITEERSYGNICVTRDGDDDYTWLGCGRSLNDVRHEYAQHLSIDALVDLVTGLQVQLFDPIWGRNHVLWPTLRRAVS